jgi:hypothetical protein
MRRCSNSLVVVPISVWSLVSYSLDFIRRSVRGYNLYVNLNKFYVYRIRLDICVSGPPREAWWPEEHHVRDTNLMPQRKSKICNTKDWPGLMASVNRKSSQLCAQESRHKQDSHTDCQPSRATLCKFTSKQGKKIWLKISREHNNLSQL